MTLSACLGLGRYRAPAAGEAPPAAVVGIGDTQMQGGQLYQSTLPNNTFPPDSFGWELYGDEP